MPASMVRRSADPDEYTSYIRATNVHLSVTEAGRFAAKLIRIDLHRLWMQRFSDTLPRVAHFDTVPGRAILSFPTQAGRGILYDGVEVQSTAMLRHCDGHSGFQRTTGSAQWGSMSLPIADMEAVGATVCGCDVTPPKEPLNVIPSPTAMERLQRLHAAAGHLAEHAPEIIASPDAARGLEQALIAAMADCLCTTDSHSSESGNRRHAMIMRKFYEILEANPGCVIHLPELCAKIGVSNRTLITCCHEALGMGPHRYLRFRQLNLARGALASADPATTTVTQVATAQGFWEPGRFAVAYRALFGELPSVTLRRDPAPKELNRINGLISSEFA